VVPTIAGQAAIDVIMPRSIKKYNQEPASYTFLLSIRVEVSTVGFDKKASMMYIL
jgi:hypothetical protein